jgi:Flp pilus assembly protein TadG
VRNRSRLGGRDHEQSRRPARRMLRRLAREERGHALTLFAVMAPVFILVLARALDVGNLYAHKR